MTAGLNPRSEVALLMSGQRRPGRYRGPLFDAEAQWLPVGHHLEVRLVACDDALWLRSRGGHREQAAAVLLQAVADEHDLLAVR
jgi:hypothetical protein